MKCRIVGREFKWLEERDDVFAPASSGLTSRTVDQNALKDDDDPDDEMVTFIIDCVSAFYQTPEDTECYCDPPKEWLIARRKAGLDTDVVWKLKKQLPGRRIAGERWTTHVATTFQQKMNMEQCPALPQFFKTTESGGRLLVEAHMDDFHGSGRRSEATAFIRKARQEFKLKASDCIVNGKYNHLKKNRYKTSEGVFVQGNPKHAIDVIGALGLQNAKSSVPPCAGPVSTLNEKNSIR